MFLRIKRCFACYFGHVHIKFNYLKILYKTVWALITAVELTMPKVGGGSLDWGITPNVIFYTNTN